MAIQERLERLLNLTAALLSSTRPLTASEIAQRVPGYPDPIESRSAFRRAFERDKEALRDMGVPLMLDLVDGSDPPVEGYRISPENYRLRDPGLDAEELAALHLATMAVQVEGIKDEGALWKLGGSSAMASDVPIVRLVATPLLATLFDAVARQSPVSFTYRSEIRHLDPLRLSYARGRWYLEGWDHDKDAERQFRLDRIEGEVEVGVPGQFERRSLNTARMHPWEMGNEPVVDAVVRIDADQAGWAVDQLGPESVVNHFEDGSIEVSITVTNHEGFRSFILGFLEHAEVLSPPELRDDVIVWLETIVGKNQ